jgi:uncharacterized beta-barrel protein YwiB (DUF1934 family)
VTMKQTVDIHFRMDISDGTEIEYNTQGELISFEDHKELYFIEELETKVATKVYIYPTHVMVKRSGDLTMEQEFIVDQITNMHLVTNFGLEVTMSTFTNLIHVEEHELTIIYETEVGETNKRYHKLFIKHE